MDWRLRFSTRPSVTRAGPYTEDAADPRLTYFASDRVIDPNNPQDNDVPEENRMREHKRIAFITDHAWKLEKRGFARVPGSGDGQASPPPGQTTEERARRELLYTPDRAVTDYKGMYDQLHEKWLVDRFRLEETAYDVPLTLHVDTAYDFLDADARTKERAARRGEETPSTTALPQPWRNVNGALGLAVAGFRLGLSTAYNIYERSPRQAAASLVLPTTLQTDVSVSIQKDRGLTDDQRSFQNTLTTTYALATSLIPPVIVNISVQHVQQNHAPTFTHDWKEATGAVYKSSSGCWGLSFLRQKDLNYDERDAQYLMQLTVIFLGQERKTSDLSPGLRRQVRPDTPANGT
jgi:hypothetical protein